MGDQGIWDLAILQNKKKMLNGETSTDSRQENSIIFIGNKGVGKTSLIHRFLERDETPKQTLALEYTFGRKTNQNLVKDVCHIWELGGGTMYTNLMETPLSPTGLLNTTVILMIDLSQPNKIWYVFETFMKALKDYITTALKTEQAKNLRIAERLDKRMSEWEKDGVCVETSSDLTLPIPLLIIGGKYDVFQFLQEEQKRVLTRTLRYLAVVHGAQLQYFSIKDNGLLKRARDLISRAAFNTEPKESMKSSLIPVGAERDSLEAIFGSEPVPKLEVIKQQFCALFPQEEGETLAKSQDPARDHAFKEPEIDMLRIQKDEDLERYRRETERRQKSWEYVDVE